MRIIRPKGEPAIIVLSKADRDRIDRIDSSIFERDSEFPKNAKVAKWKKINKQTKKQAHLSDDNICAFWAFFVFLILLFYWLN